MGKQKRKKIECFKCAILIIIFWAMNTFSAGISIPKSPLATIMPSLASKISV